MKKIISLILSLVLVLSLAACGSENGKSADLKALYESYGEYLPEMYFPDNDTMLNLLGIQTEDCVQFQVALCAEGLRADEVWLIEARDQEALDRLQQLAETRIQARLDETESYVPDQYLVVQKAVLLTNGRYLALLISPQVDQLQAGFEAALQ